MKKTFMEFLKFFLGAPKSVKSQLIHIIFGNKERFPEEYEATLDVEAIQIAVPVGRRKDIVHLNLCEIPISRISPKLFSFYFQLPRVIVLSVDMSSKVKVEVLKKYKQVCKQEIDRFNRDEDCKKLRFPLPLLLS